MGNVKTKEGKVDGVFSMPYPSVMGTSRDKTTIKYQFLKSVISWISIDQIFRKFTLKYFTYDFQNLGVIIKLFIFKTK